LSRFTKRTALVEKCVKFLFSAAPLFFDRGSYGSTFGVNGLGGLGGGLDGLEGIGEAEVGGNRAVGCHEHAGVTLGLEFAEFGERAAEYVVGLGSGSVD
jgi:hypothetical protein